MVATLLLLCLVFVPSQAVDYTEGGDNWEDLCEEGHEQSPIDVTTYLEVFDVSEAARVDLDYKTLDVQGGFTDHNYQISDDWGSITFKQNGVEVTASSPQFHFHAPSEHEIDGESYDLELHIVNASEDGSLYVVGIIFEEGEENDFLQDVIDSTSQTTEIDLMDVFDGLDELTYFYNYDGSLTTPPCSQGVTWILWADIQEASQEQIAFFTAEWADDVSFADGNGNNRVTQPYHGRDIKLMNSFASIAAFAASLLVLNFI